MSTILRSKIREIATIHSALFFSHTDKEIARFIRHDIAMVREARALVYADFDLAQTDAYRTGFSGSKS